MVKSRTRRAAGVLRVVGTGLLLGGHMTRQAEHEIRTADRVFYLLNSPLMESWIRDMNPRSETLVDLYVPGRLRSVTYSLMVKRICQAVEAGQRVCAVFYGHPGVLAQAPHAAIRRLRRQGIDAGMLPAISADACLFADLGVNPGDGGYACFEATDFLVSRRRFDSTSHLVLWQVGLLGVTGPATGRSAAQRHLQLLVRRLRRWYSAAHKVVLYAASAFPWTPMVAVQCRLDRVANLEILPMMTMYVPPRVGRAVDRDALRRLHHLAES